MASASFASVHIKFFKCYATLNSSLNKCIIHYLIYNSSRGLQYYGGGDTLPPHTLINLGYYHDGVILDNQVIGL